MATQAQKVIEERVVPWAWAQRDEFVKRVQDQKFPAFDAVPLNPKYKAWKIAHGLDPRVMMRTGHYIQAIKVLVERPKKTRLDIWIGFRKGDRAIDIHGVPVPLRLNLLDRVQEEGSHNLHVPARPHWGPFQANMKVRAKAVRRLLREDLVKRTQKVLAGVR